MGINFNKDFYKTQDNFMDLCYLHLNFIHKITYNNRDLVIKKIGELQKNLRIYKGTLKNLYLKGD